MIKLFKQNKKIIFIIIFIFVAGLSFQVARSQTLLKGISQERLQFNQEVLRTTPINSNYQVINNPEFCIVYSPNSIAIKSNIEAMLNYMKKSYQLYDTSLSAVQMEKCPSLLFASPYIGDLGTIDAIERYVGNGGNLYFLQTVEPDENFLLLYRKLGIIDYHGFTVTSGLHFKDEVLIGSKDKKFLENEINDYSLNITINNTSNASIVNTNNTPILWDVSFNKGNYIILNSNILQTKIARGLFSGIIGKYEEQFIYPIFNAKVFYIDDFPSPIGSERNELIYSEYKKDLASFYSTIWWPDMIKIANKYNLFYTGAFIQSYDDNVKPPFRQTDENSFNYFINFGRELIKGNGELSLHGYNHQSLTMDKNISKAFGYNTWTSSDYMGEAINEALTYLRKAFPSYVATSYVPPSNVLSVEGRQALIDHMEHLISINSLYNEDVSGNGYIQEFEIKDRIIEMPRISSGYYPEINKQWEIINAVTSHGYFSHFVHPDDIISEDRSKAGWKETSIIFEQFMEQIHNDYPWLHASTSTNAAYSVANTLHAQIELTTDDRGIKGSLKNNELSQFFILRTMKKISDLKNCTVEKISDNIYLVEVERGNFSIGLRGNE